MSNEDIDKAAEAHIQQLKILKHGDAAWVQDNVYTIQHKDGTITKVPEIFSFTSGAKWAMEQREKEVQELTNRVAELSETIKLLLLST